MSKLNLGLLGLDELSVAVGLLIVSIKDWQERVKNARHETEAELFQDVINDRRRNLGAFVATIDELDADLATSIRQQIEEEIGA